jgi:putative transcriptional regulator
MVKNRLKEIRMREFMMEPGEFSKFLGISNKVYWSWENDKSRPTLETALEIANKLNKDVKDIWHLE